MKTSKRIISFVLCALMVASCFFCTGKLPELEAHADVTLGGITQTRVVSNYESLYRSYQKRFFGGEETNWPTNFVIPGLSSADDYTPQGMTYWAEKEWILISAYDAGGSDPSVVYALDVVTTNLVAVFKIQNADGTTNTSHGGGIAASKYNFYYADSDSKISYVPLSEMDITGGEKTIKLRDSIDLAPEMTRETTVKTSYCCYDEGVLWTGNFYLSGNASYGNGFLPSNNYPSVLMGYKLAGNSSEEEWYYLKNGYNLVKLNKDSTTDDQTSGTATYKSYNVDGANIEIKGSIATSAALGEVTVSFCSVNLTEGKKYKVEYIADNNLTDMYFFAPNGSHCNVKQSQATKITALGDGRYHYQMIFTAGLKPTGADSSWPTTQSTNGTYTGTYTMRFDQDSVPAGGRSFYITDFSVSEYVEPQGFTPDSKYEGIGCQGNPTYVVLLNTDRVQYAMVDKGKIYISRSWSRTESTNHVRELVIGDMDLGIPGTSTETINGRSRPVYILDYANATKFNGSNMLWMGEALCVINDYLYMFGESAAWTYNGKEDSKCSEPIDVIWKIDQYAIQGLQRPHEDVAAVEYEKVDSLSELNDTDEYIVLYESSIKDSLTQKNVLYLLDSYGGYDEMKLPKKAAATTTDVTAASTGDSRGIVGYEIRDYSVTIDEETGKEKLILSAEDDANKSLHWQFESGSSNALKLYNRDLYYAKHPYLYVGDSLLAMTASASSTMNIKDWGNGTFTIYGSGEDYSLWCNDGSVPESVAKYSNFYKNYTRTPYVPNYHNLDEVAGTFHVTNNTQPALPTNEQQGLQIYKRVSDPYASSYETQVYTDLQAELTSDGTYNITLETYATNNLQYQRVDERPTDFIFVVDSSGSMDATDAYGYNTEIDNWSALTMKQAAGDNNDIAENSNYNIEWTSNFYYKLPDGEFARISVAVNQGSDGTYSRDIWLWCKHPVTGRCYKISLNGYLVINNTTGNPSTDSASRLTDAMYLANPSAYGYASASEILAEASSDINRTDYHSSRNSKDSRRAYEVLKYPYTDDYGNSVASYYSYGACQRILGVKQAMDKLVVKIQNEASRTGLDHRVALVSSASDARDSNYVWTNTGLYTNDNGTTMTQYTGTNSISAATYKKAFFSASQFPTLRAIINKMYPLGHTFLNHGLNMADNIISNSDYKYDVTGTRSAVVIVFSDGAAGGDAKSYANITNSNEAANGAISSALNLKHNGAYVFTVQVGTATGDYKVSGFEEADFMKYLSSKYTGSQSMSAPGPLNTKENEYYIQVPTGTSFNIDTVTNTVFNSVVANSNNAISWLTAEAILREHLTDAFDTSNASIKFETAQSKYDGIGRLYFEDPVTETGFTFSRPSPNVAEISGFDYSANNVSEYNSNLGNGKKLIVTISGVIANADAELLNTSINDTDYTAIYEDSTYKNQNQPVKKFPTYHFSIPEYTFYMDYDIPMYDNDVNGTLCSVDSTLQKQSTYKTSLSTSNMGIQFVNSNQDMIYTLNSQGGLTENLSKGYVLIQRDDGTYDWFRLNIVPASTVYYEENKMETLNGTSGYTVWTPTGSYDGKYQSLSTDGDIFGNDYTYSSSTDSFSLGTNKSVTVTSSAKRSDTQTFTFTGTGFDLVSACGPNTGIQTVVVRDADGNLVQTFIVDTFYNDTTYGTIYQVPIVQFKGAYGTYNVQTTAAYYSFAGALKTQSVDVNALGDTGIEAYSATAETSVTDKFFAEIGMDELIGQDVELIWMDEESVLNGGIGATETTVSTQAGESTTTPATSLINYIDGFRIYNPVDYNDEYIVSEKNATFYSVIDAITAGGMGGDGDTLAAYIEPGATGDITFGNYLTSGGPKYEVYLEKGDSIAFRFKANDFKYNYPRAMVSVRAASGTPKAKFASSADPNHAYEISVTSGSETYYDITDNSLGVGTDGSFVLTITNTGSGLLAVDNIKIVNATLVPLSGVSLAELEAIISTQAVEINPNEMKYSPVTFVDAPADNPAIDPEGKIPTLEEYIAIHGSGNNGDDHSGADSLADKLIAIVEKVIDFIKKVIALVANTVTNIF